MFILESNNSLTIVIPTVGRLSLVETLNCINKSSILPEKVLVVVPKEYADSIDKMNLQYNWLKIIRTDFKGQVRQRIHGFSLSKTKYTIQLDDDCFIQKHCIKNLLIKAESLDDNFCIGPIFIDKGSNLDYFRLVKGNRLLTSPNNMLRKLFNKFLHGRKRFSSGIITQSGMIIHPNRFESPSDLYKVEWLCGGMILHQTKNLIKENYYPFSGKAYCEDLMHSELIKRKNVEIYISQDSFVTHDYEQVQTNRDSRLIYSLVDLINEQFSWFRAMKYFMRLTGRPIIRLYLMNIFNILRLIKDAIMRRILGRNLGPDQNKVCHIISNLGQGGAENALFRHITNDTSDVEHFVISLMDSGHYGKKLKNLGVRVYTLNMPRGRVKFLRALRLYRVLRNEKPKIVQTWMHHADLFGGLIAKIARIKTVYWCIRGPYNSNILSNTTKLTAFLCVIFSYFIPKKIISNSYYARDSYIKIGYPRRKIKVIQNGYSNRFLSRVHKARDSLIKEFDLDPNLPIFGMIARYDPFKDHKTLLKSLALLKKDHNFNCFLIGNNVDSNNSELVSMIDLLGLSNNVHMLGAKDNVSHFMSAFDIHILSTLDESFPNVVAESMLCGTPCVVSNVGDVNMIVSGYGWISDPGNSVSLYNTISESLREYFFNDLSKKNLLEENCISHIKSNFSFKKMIYSFNLAWFYE